MWNHAPGELDGAGSEMLAQQVSVADGHAPMIARTDCGLSSG